MGSPRDTSPAPPAPARARLAGLGSVALWYVLPGLVVLLVVAYIGMATVGHVDPPVVPVDGVSMRPTLAAGDLVFLKSVDPKRLRKGDIVAVNVPSADRKKYDLPARIVHRIVAIGHDANGLVFTTKGDANTGADVFQSHAGDVVGQLWFAAPGLGYPLLFFRSRQGEIFLGAAALLVLLYFGLGLFEDRRVVAEGTAVTMQALLEETHVLRDTLARAEHLGLPPGPAGPLATTPAPVDDELLGEIRIAAARSRETAETMRELVAAIGEYGEHLRSHTAVMQSLAVTTAELERATRELRVSVAGGPSAATASGSLRELRQRLEERRVRVDAVLVELDRRLREARWPSLATPAD